MVVDVDVIHSVYAPGPQSEMITDHIARGGDDAADFPRRRLGMPSQLDTTLLYLVTNCATM